VQNYAFLKIEQLPTDEPTRKISLAFFKLYATITKTYWIVEVGANSIHIPVCQEGSATSIGSGAFWHIHSV